MILLVWNLELKAIYDQLLHDHKLIMPLLVKEETLKNGMITINI